MEIACYTSNTLTEFVMQVCQIKNQMIQGGNEHNESILFRGQANEAFELIPSIARPVLTGNLISEERNLIELAMLKLPDVFKADMRPLERLALLQHYGIPTRLLDVTENALVALYFACCSNNANNGEIIIFKSNDSKVTPLPISEAICDSYRFATSGTFLTDFYDNIINQPYYLEHQLLYKSYITDSSQKTLWVEQYCDKPHFTHAPIRSLRQQVQRGRYLLFANDYNPISSSEAFFEADIVPISKNDDSMIVGRIQIPSDAKKSLLHDLDIFGVSKSSLFCDSIETICSEIKNLCECKLL